MPPQKETLMVSHDFTVYNTEITLALPKLEITFVRAIFSVVYMGFSFCVNLQFDKE